MSGRDLYDIDVVLLDTRCLNTVKILTINLTIRNLVDHPFRVLELNML